MGFCTKLGLGLIVSTTLFAIWVGSFSRWEHAVVHFVQKIADTATTLMSFSDYGTFFPSTHQRLLLMRKIAPTPPRSPDLAYETVGSFTTSDGAQLPILVFKSKKTVPGKLLKIVIEYHAGGHVIGDYQNAMLAPDMALKYDVVGFSIAYRKAPEFKFPTAPQDCYEGLKWVHANAARFGADPTKIAVTGVSAGGNLAAAVALMARDDKEHGPKISAMYLHAPVLDFFLDSKEQSIFTTTPLWNSQLAIAARFFYTKSIEEWSDQRASPVRAKSLAGLPPVLLVVNSLDPLRGEGVMLAERLKSAGTPVEFFEFDGYHVADIVVNQMAGGYVEEAKVRSDAIDKILKKNLGVKPL